MDDSCTRSILRSGSLVCRAVAAASWTVRPILLSLSLSQYILRDTLDTCGLRIHTARPRCRVRVQPVLLGGLPGANAAAQTEQGRWSGGRVNVSLGFTVAEMRERGRRNVLFSHCCNWATVRSLRAIRIPEIPP